MATLFEMSTQMKHLYELLESEEIDEETFKDTLESIGIDEKLESYVYIQRQFESDLEAYKTEKERIEKKMKTCKNAIDRMKQSMLDFMKCAGIKKTKAGTFDIGIGRSESVNISSMADIPEEFFIQQEPKIDKTAIKKKLKSGETVKGAELIENEFLRVR